MRWDCFKEAWRYGARSFLSFLVCDLGKIVHLIPEHG